MADKPDFFPPEESYWRNAWSRLKAQPAAVFAMSLLAFLFFMAFKTRGVYG